MKFKITSLTLYLEQSQEVIDFTRLSYFYGKVGAGKSSIAKLIDYCLGGEFKLTPALQQYGFIGSQLDVEMESGRLEIYRNWKASNIRTRWIPQDEPLAVSDRLVTPRKSGKNDSNETISDLIFRLAGTSAVKVSKSKTGVSTDLTTISLRDLLWYCYIDQQDIDSTFFNLTDSAPWIANKSADVLRLILGMHNARIQQLEHEIDTIKKLRVQAEDYLRSLQIALTETEAGDTNTLIANILRLQENSTALTLEIEKEQQLLKEKTVSGATEELRRACQEISVTIITLEKNIEGLRTKLDSDAKQLNEISGLSLKFDRASSAKDIFANVDYKVCPRCTQHLPEREPDYCVVCGQTEPTMVASEDLELAKADIDVRANELKEINSIQQQNIELLQSQRKTLVSELYKREVELNKALSEYDSAYLSTIILKQKQLGANAQQVTYLSKLLSIARKADENKVTIGLLKIRESELKKVLKEAKEEDNSAKILRRLEKYFLDVLISVRFPGLTQNSQVTISSKNFKPELNNTSLTEGASRVVATFDNISSGGKMSIFKACFAIAIHRITLEEGSFLPDLLIIDSPMKNISERENQELFESFYQMIYALAANEMYSTQFILIDKELVAPADKDLLSEFSVRHMTPDDPEFPPLIRSHQKGL
jgi:hypothetical protein